MPASSLPSFVAAVGRPSLLGAAGALSFAHPLSSPDAASYGGRPRCWSALAVPRLARSTLRCSRFLLFSNFAFVSMISHHIAMNTFSRVWPMPTAVMFACLQCIKPAICPWNLFSLIYTSIFTLMLGARDGDIFFAVWPVMKMNSYLTLQMRSPPWDLRYFVSFMSKLLFLAWCSMHVMEIFFPRMACDENELGGQPIHVS